MRNVAQNARAKSKTPANNNVAEICTERIRKTNVKFFVRKYTPKTSKHLQPITLQVIQTD